jgi:hypothetical protein
MELMELLSFLQRKRMGVSVCVLTTELLMLKLVMTSILYPGQTSYYNVWMVLLFLVK